MTKTTVLLMAYGSPGAPEDVRPYLSDIRGGRDVSDEAVAELTARYARIGFPTPLLAITRRQAAALERRLSVPVVVGMKHWRPSIADAVREIAAEHVVAVALAPHYSSISIGGYEERVLKARADAGATFEVSMVRDWHERPELVEYWSARIRDALTPGAHVLFTAHSLPARILAEGDPYKDQLMASASMIAERAGARSWELAFQSASGAGEPWLDPDVGERLAAADDHAIVAPIGFVSDHLEIMFDLDVELASQAARRRIRVTRIRVPNDDPLLIEALAQTVLGVIS